jgi:hypothetical protein
MARDVIGSLPSTARARFGFEFAEAFGGNTNEAIRTDPRLESAGSFPQCMSLLLAHTDQIQYVGSGPVLWVHRK